MIANKNINLELENLRKFVSTACLNDPNKVLFKKTARIHASYLFHPFGQKVLQDICSTISSTGLINQINGWKDLAGYLGLTFHQIGCIQNYSYIDNTEMVLMAYAQGDNASLYEILKVLLDIQRPDAVTKAQASIIKMVDAVLMLHNQTESEVYEDGIRVSNDNYEITVSRECLLRPNNFLRIKQELPITLRKLTSSESSSPTCLKSVQPIVLPSIESVTSCQRSAPFSHSRKDVCSSSSVVINSQKKRMKTVLLTFVDDGREIAYLVAKQLRKDRSSSFPIGVIILDEQEKYVTANAERFIVRCFAQTDYVVPIITKEYLKVLNHGSSAITKCALSSLDSRYAVFIHDLMIKYYVDNQCRNSKIRCIIPHPCNNLFESSILRCDPTLRIWMYENEVDNFVSRISVKKD